MYGLARLRAGDGVVGHAPATGNLSGAKSALRTAAALANEPSKRATRKTVDEVEGEEPPPPTRPAVKSTRKRPSEPPEISFASESLDEANTLLREQVADVKQQEARLMARQESLRMIYDDIRAELAVVDDIRRRTSDELAAVERRGLAVAQRDRQTTPNTQPTKSRPAETPLEPAETLKTSTDSPSVRSAALLIRRLADQGHTDSAVSLLNRMKEREAAKVLASLSTLDPRLALRITENLQAVKQQPIRR